MSKETEQEAELRNLDIENSRLLQELESLRVENQRLRQVNSAERQRLVLLESPYAGDIEVNVAYARAAMRECLLHGEAPYASHLLYTQPGVLTDEVPTERSMGIEAGLAWGSCADATVVYTDLGVSKGMSLGIERARRLGRRVEIRTLSTWQQDMKKAAGQ